MSTPTRTRIQFAGPRDVEVVREPVERPAADEVLVRTRYSAISPGTERLIYLGQAPNEMEVDASIEALQDGSFSYPLSYGYACAGRVEATGEDVGAEWQDAPVFGFQPHTSRFTARPDTLVRVPASVDLTDAVMIPSLETAVNLVMDGRPMIGETVVVFGQGIVGLLTTRLLANHPVDDLLTIDSVADRRALSLRMGATKTGASPTIVTDTEETAGPNAEAGTQEPSRADLVYELTGDPTALDDAIDVTGYGGRLVVGSWYGEKTAPIDLGRHFHRSRMTILSSQVSTIAPRYRGRWSKSRRMSVVVDLLPDIEPGRLISDYFDVEEAEAAYERLSAGDDLLQPVFVYE